MSVFETPEQIAADIAQMYTENEASWIRNVWSRDANGNNVQPIDPNAVCWCLRGAIDARIPKVSVKLDIDAFHERDRIARATYRAFDKILGFEDPEDFTQLHFVR